MFKRTIEKPNLATPHPSMSFMDQIPGGGNYPKLPVECLPNFPIQPSLTFRGRNDSHKLKNFISEIMLNMSMISWPNDASRIVYCRRHLLTPAAQWANDFVQEQGILEITFTHSYKDYINISISHQISIKSLMESRNFPKLNLVLSVSTNDSERFGTECHQTS